MMLSHNNFFRKIIALMLCLSLIAPQTLLRADDSAVTATNPNASSATVPADQSNSRADLAVFLKSGPSEQPDSLQGNPIVTTVQDPDGFAPVSDTDADDAKRMLNLEEKPAFEKALMAEGACTNAMPPHCWGSQTTEYYDQNKTFVGKKVFNYDEPNSGENAGQYLTETKWFDSNNIEINQAAIDAANAQAAADAETARIAAEAQSIADAEAARLAAIAQETADEYTRQAAMVAENEANMQRERDEQMARQQAADQAINMMNSSYPSYYGFNVGYDSQSNTVTATHADGTLHTLHLSDNTMTSFSPVETMNQKLSATSYTMAGSPSFDSSTRLWTANLYLNWTSNGATLTYDPATGSMTINDPEQARLAQMVADEAAAQAQRNSDALSTAQSRHGDVADVFSEYMNNHGQNAIRVVTRNGQVYNYDSTGNWLMSSSDLNSQFYGTDETIYDSATHSFKLIDHESGVRTVSLDGTILSELNMSSLYANVSSTSWNASSRTFHIDQTDGSWAEFSADTLTETARYVVPAWVGPASEEIQNTIAIEEVAQSVSFGDTTVFENSPVVELITQSPDAVMTDSVQESTITSTSNNDAVEKADLEQKIKEKTSELAQAEKDLAVAIEKKQNHDADFAALTSKEAELKAEQEILSLERQNISSNADERNADDVARLTEIEKRMTDIDSELVQNNAESRKSVLSALIAEDEIDIDQVKQPLVNDLNIELADLKERLSLLQENQAISNELLSSSDSLLDATIPQDSDSMPDLIDSTTLDENSAATEETNSEDSITDANNSFISAPSSDDEESVNSEADAAGDEMIDDETAIDFDNTGSTDDNSLDTSTESDEDNSTANDTTEDPASDSNVETEDNQELGDEQATDATSEESAALNDTTGQAHVKTAAPPTKPSDEEISINFSRDSSGQVDIAATLANTKARINQYFNAGDTVSAGKLILAAVNYAMLSVADFTGYISKIINGYTTSDGKKINNDGPTATTLIVRAIQSRDILTRAKVIDYIDRFLAMGKYKNNQAYPALAEAIIVATIKYPEVVILPGIIWNKQILRSSDQVSWEPLTTYINKLITLNEISGATNIITAQIQFYKMANAVITDMPAMQAFLTKYLDQFLALGKYSANTKTYPDEAEKIITACISGGRALLLAGSISKYVNYFLSLKTSAETDRAVNILADAIQSGMMSNAVIVDYVNQFLALGKHISNPIHIEKAEQIISAALNAQPATSLTSAQIKTFIDRFIALNELNTAASLISAAIHVYPLPLLDSVQIKTYIDRFIALNKIDMATDILVETIRIWGLHRVTNAVLVGYLNRFLPAPTKANPSPISYPEYAEKIISAALNTQVPMLNSAQINTYIAYFMNTAKDIDRATRILIDAIQTPGLYLIENATLVGYLNKLLPIPTAKIPNPTSYPDNAEKIISAALNTQVPVLNSAQINTYIAYFMNTAKDLDRATRILVDAIQTPGMYLIPNATLVGYLNKLLPMPTAKIPNPTSYLDNAEKIISAALNTQVPALNSAQINTYIAYFMNTAKDLDRATRILVEAIQTPGMYLIPNATLVLYLNQFLAIGAVNKNRTPSLDNAEKIISAALNTQVPAINSAQINTYIAYFMDTAKDLDRATRILVDAIQTPGLYLIQNAALVGYLNKLLPIPTKANPNPISYPKNAEQIIQAVLSAPPHPTLTSAQVITYIGTLLKKGESELAKNLIMRTYNINGMMTPAQFKNYIDQFLAVGAYSQNTVYMAAAKALLLEAISRSGQLYSQTILTKGQVLVYLKIISDRKELDAASDIAKRARAVGILTVDEAKPYIRATTSSSTSGNTAKAAAKDDGSPENSASEINTGSNTDGSGSSSDDSGNSSSSQSSENSDSSWDNNSNSTENSSSDGSNSNGSGSSSDDGGSSSNSDYSSDESNSDDGSDSSSDDGGNSSNDDSSSDGSNSDDSGSSSDDGGNPSSDDSSSDGSNSNDSSYSSNDDSNYPSSDASLNT